jgi:benzoate/toluate 1,2-dioxygenase reductase subunit
MDMVTGAIITKGLFTDKLVRLKIKNLIPTQVSYKPGQYVSMQVSENEFVPCYIFRYYDEINAFEIVANIAEGSPSANFIKSKGVGENVVYSVPQGKLLMDENEEEIYFICEGVYASPFISFLYHVDHSTRKPHMSLFWGVKDEEELFLVNTVYAFSTTMPRFTYDIFISEGTSTINHRPGRVVDALGKVKLEPEAKIYICGENTMISEVNAVLKSKNVSPENIIFEKLT